MAENFGYDFDGDTGTEGNGGGEGVAADVGGYGFLYATGHGKSLEVAIIHVIGKMRQLAVVAVEDFNDGGQEDQ